MATKMKTFRVTMQMWRETWGGSDSRDGEHVEIVQAANAEQAISKAKSKALNPGRGRGWSHSRWTTNETAVQISPETTMHTGTFMPPRPRPKKFYVLLRDTDLPDDENQLFVFKTRAEAKAFKLGIEHVNDSALTVVGIYNENCRSAVLVKAKRLGHID